MKAISNLEISTLKNVQKKPRFKLALEKKETMLITINAQITILRILLIYQFEHRITSQLYLEKLKICDMLKLSLELLNIANKIIEFLSRTEPKLDSFDT